MNTGYVAILLDETGSMAGQEKRVVTGINEYINQLGSQLDGAPCKAALNLFDSERWREYFRGDLSDFPQMKLKDYRPGARTPLYDAIAKTISMVEADAGDSKVLVIIDTDGMENASVEVTRDTIFKQIKDKEDEGWTFVFLGANMEQFGGAFEAQHQMGLGLKAGNVMSTSHVERSATYGMAARATSSYLRDESKTSDEEFWKRAGEEDEDFQ